MSFFDKALSGVLDGIERNIVDQVKDAATAALEEYPAQHAPTQAVRPAEWDKAAQAISAWRLIDLEGRREELQGHLEAFKEHAASSSAFPQRGPVKAEAVLLELCSRVLTAPPVVSYICEGLAAQETLAGLQKEVVRLQKQTQAAEREAALAVSSASQAQRADTERAELTQKLGEEAARATALQQELAGLKELQSRFGSQSLELSQTRAALTSLQGEHQRTQNEVFELRSCQEAEVFARSDDAELAAQDHERLQSRIRELERDSQHLNIQLQQALAGTGQDDAATAGEAQRGMDSAPSSSLHKDIRVLEEGRQAALAETDALHGRVKMLEQHNKLLEGQLQERPSQEEVLKLRSRLGTAEALLDAQMAAEGEPEENGRPPADSLMGTLQARNRRLVSENTSLRHRAAAAESSWEEARQEVQAEAAARAAQEALVQRLEHDLLTSLRGHEEPGAGGAAEGELGGQPGEQQQEGSGILQILTGQRDRFRKRMEELEETAGQSAQQAASCKAQMEALEQDNLGLCEQIKYLRKYRVAQPASKAASHTGAPHPGGSQPSHRLSCGPLQLNLSGEAGVRSRNRGARFSCFGGGDTADEEMAAPKTAAEQRYSKAYEAKINPFLDFQASERDAALAAHERALLSGSKMLLSNRVGRAFAAVYLLAVHVFLFCIVYYIMIASAA